MSFRYMRVSGICVCMSGNKYYIPNNHINVKQHSPSLYIVTHLHIISGHTLDALINYATLYYSGNSVSHNIYVTIIL